MSVRLRLAFAAIVALAGAAACGGDGETAPASTPTASSTTGAGGGGGGATGCPPGELEDAGACVPAGVPAAACGEGFVPTADGACDAVVPAAPCPPGAITRLGSTACAEIMPCGAPPWGAITDADQHVDASYAGADSDGTAAHPWTTIAEALAAAADGDLVAIAAGDYDAVIVDRPVRLEGRCPALVHLAGPADAFAVDITAGADGTEVRGLSVTGQEGGVVVVGAQGVVLSELWVHDLPWHAVEAVAGADVVLRASLIEAFADSGALVSAAHLAIEDSEVREPTPGIWTWSVTAQSAATLSMLRTIVTGGNGMGVAVGGSEATLDSVLVRDVVPFGPAGGPKAGWGVGAGGEGMIARAKLAVRRSVIERASGAGISVSGSDGEIEHTVVRDTQPGEEDGGGAAVRALSWPDARAAVVARQSVFERSVMVGALALGADASLEGVVVRDTAAAASGEFGRGVAAQKDVTLPDGHAAVSLRGCVIERNREVGAWASSSSLELDATVVRDTLPAADSGAFGRGLSVQATVGASAIEGRLTVLRSLVERSSDVGLWFTGTELVVEDSTIRDVAPRQMDGRFGDGIAVAELGAGTSARIARSRVESVARAGIASFGAATAIEATTVECAPIPLDSETFLGVEPTFEDLGGNVCGCGPDAGACQVQAASLEAPEPLL